MPVRFGIIGAGMMAREHISNIRLQQGADVRAIADPVQAEIEKARLLAGEQALEFADHESLLADTDCDAFIIATPNDTHFRILTDVLKAGKPVLIEKPLCTSSADCRSVISSAARGRAPVWVAMEYRYMPPLTYMQEQLAKETAGKPVMMSIREHRYPFLDKVDDWNRFNSRTGGTLVEKCCHFWDLMRLFLNSDPVRVFASGSVAVNHLDEEYDGRRPDIIDNAYAVVDFANGARGMLDLCMFGEGAYWQEIVSVSGPKGRLEAKVPGPARFVRGGEKRDSRVEFSHRNGLVDARTFEIDEDILDAGDHHGATFFQHRKFLEMIQSGRGRPEVTLDDGYKAVLTGEAAELSIREGRAVDVSELC